MITFKQFLSEDVAGDEAEMTKLQTQISQLVARKNQQNKPIDQQITRLQQMLAAKQKAVQAAQAQQKRAPATPGATPPTGVTPAPAVAPAMPTAPKA